MGAFDVLPTIAPGSHSATILQGCREAVKVELVPEALVPAALTPLNPKTNQIQVKESYLSKYLNHDSE